MSLWCLQIDAAQERHEGRLGGGFLRLRPGFGPGRGGRCPGGILLFLFGPIPLGGRIGFVGALIGGDSLFKIVLCGVIVLPVWRGRLLDERR